MKIEYKLPQKTSKQKLSVKIDLYDYATELYTELDKIGIIERINEIPQLGVIKVGKKFSKTRFDYVKLQLHLHQVVKNKLSNNLRFTYNNPINANEFRQDYVYPGNSKKPSIGDILQLLTIVYNIGHFYNTFTASRAITMLAEEDNAFHDMVVNACKDQRYQSAANSILESKNYQRLHLLNSILILEQCDKSKPSISLALEILYSYINEQSLAEESKLKYIFDVFRTIRTVAYLAFDLQLAKLPLSINLNNKDEMKTLLKELLSEYNNNKPSIQLIRSISKLLDDILYNENSYAICYYRISRKMVSLIKNESDYANANYYNDFFMAKTSVLNQPYKQNKDHMESPILKLTFASEERKVFEALLVELEKTNNTRVGYYDRHSGEQTLLVSIRKDCSLETKRHAAYKTLKYTVKYLRRIPGISSHDSRFLLLVKYFLQNLFDENHVNIQTTINRDICVVCTRGKSERIKELKSLLKASVGTEDANHEVEFMLKQLQDDSKSDTTITIPASIVVYNKKKEGEKQSEFDGLIIHPFREANQIIFLEAKNRNKKQSLAQKNLAQKLVKYSFGDVCDDIKIVGRDAYWKYSI